MKRQRGISLVAVVVIMGLLGAAAVFALISMRQERNLFAEGWDKVGATAAAVAMPAAAPTGSSMRRFWRESAVILPSALAMPAQICTVGPSRPSAAPDPIWIMPITNLPIATRSGSSPPLMA